MSLTQKMIVRAANYLLTQKVSILSTLSISYTVSAMWAKHFLQHNSQYLKCKQKLLAAVRKNSHSVKSLKEYFAAYKSIKEKLGVADQDTWNMDETGFRVGCGKAHWVITTNPNRPLLLSDPDNRDYLISVKCISEGDRDILSMLIIAGVNILEKWEYNDLSENILFTISETGYSNDELTVAWLHHFKIHSQ